jgi:hypothetical protein
MSATLKIDLHGCAPGEAKFYGFHTNGTQHAAFCDAGGARDWWNGLGRHWQSYFYVTDSEGRRVASFSGSSSHAHAILAAVAQEEER